MSDSIPNPGNSTPNPGKDEPPSPGEALPMRPVSRPRQALGAVPPIFTLIGRVFQPETERYNIMVKVRHPSLRRHGTA